MNLIFPKTVQCISIADSQIDAKGAVVIEAETGRVLLEKNKDKQLPMASTTKIMTATIIIENCNLNETVEISKNTLVELVRSHLIFNALTYGGVDNWGGYGENFNEEKAEILNYLPEIREEFCKEGYCEDLEDMPSFREIAQKLVDHDIKNFDF